MGSGASYVGFHGGLWQSVHIDDLRKSTVMVSDVTKLQDVAISQLFKPEENPESEPGHGAGDGREEAEETQAAGSGEAAEAGLGTEGSELLGSGCAERGRSNVSSGSFSFLGLPEGQATLEVASPSPLE